VADPVEPSEGQRPLDEPKLKDLEALIRKSFRVRENQTPVYVDVSDNLARVGLEQHQIVFGRRGSGKSCLLVYFRRTVAKRNRVRAISINGDTVKTLDYPDVLIRLLLAVFENLPARRRLRRLIGRAFKRHSPPAAMIEELRGLLSLDPKVEERQSQQGSSSTRRREGP
jgi:hypothetical protein